MGGKKSTKSHFEVEMQFKYKIYLYYSGLSVSYCYSLFLDFLNLFFFFVFSVLPVLPKDSNDRNSEHLF